MNRDFIHEFRFGPNAVAEGLAAVSRFAASADLGDDGDVIALVVEELLFNLVDHGDAPADDPIMLILRQSPEGVRLVLDSGGTPFDPREARADRAIPDRGGGAGLALVRAWSRIEASESVDGRNRLRLLVPRPARPETGAPSARVGQT